jgi:glycosyltransferase involved in cell wall biosynthesis
VTLDFGPPATLPAGTASAIFLAGSADAELELTVDGVAYPVQRVGPWFWATVDVTARAGPIEVRAGDQLLATIEVVEPAPAAPQSDLIAVCMATFDPDPALFRVQVESLRAQTDERWTCVIRDDGSSEERFAELLSAIDGDARFAVHRSERRLGFYRNFERAIGLAPPEAGLLALADQDDRWHPEKLATLRAALGSAALAYSDQRLTDAAGRVLRDTLWQGRRNNHTDIASQLVANTVAGAAVLFPRRLLDVALPFPHVPGVPFHDHWLGLAAMAAGEVAFVDRPLYDYVQHRGAVFGDVAAGDRGARRADLRTRWRAAYFYGYVPRAVYARTLLLRTVPEADGRRALRRFVAAERSAAALAWLAGRSTRTLAGRNETLGSELDLARGVLWRRLGAGGDASLPPVESFEQRRMRRWRARLEGGGRW